MKTLSSIIIVGSATLGMVKQMSTDSYQTIIHPLAQAQSLQQME